MVNKAHYYRVVDVKSSSPITLIGRTVFYVSSGGLEDPEVDFLAIRYNRVYYKETVLKVVKFWKEACNHQQLMHWKDLGVDGEIVTEPIGWQQ